MAALEEILKKAELHCSHILSNDLDSVYVYHNLEHTQGVVHAASELGKGLNLSESDQLLLKLAAWFHDLGYIEGYENHEKRGVEKMRAFGAENGLTEAQMDTIEAAILDTQMPPNPQSNLGKILADADLSHIGSAGYLERGNVLRAEWQQTGQREFTDLEWLLLSKEFISNHQYNTELAKLTYGPMKEENLKEIKVAIQHQKTTGGDQAALAKIDSDAPKGEKKKKKGKKGKSKDAKPDRGIETMFRVTLKNHTALSQIADNKANMLLSINAIIISILLSALLPRIHKNPELVLPMFILLTICVVTMVFATFSTIPKVTEGNASREAISRRETNLLFFGNFHKMKLQDYEWGMEEVMNDRNYLYGSMVKDLYFLGRVLHKKYRYLRFAYGFFMFGMIISVLAFILAYVL